MGLAAVNMSNRAASFAKAPEPGLLGGVVPVAFNRNAMLTGYVRPEQKFITCPNQDVVYGASFFALDKEPIVFQIPEFGDRFWVYALYDARTDEFSEIGKQHGTKPGFYLMAGPGWKGDPPAGITAIVRSSTTSVFAAPRIFMNDTPEDHAAIQPVINQVAFYPLGEFDGKMKTKDWSKLPHFPAPESKGETRWVNPETFFDELPVVMKQVAPLPGEEAFYKWIGSVPGSFREGPGGQGNPDGSSDRGRARPDRTAVPMAQQRWSGRQWLEYAGECRAVGNRLPESYSHGQIEHVRQSAG